MRPLSTQQKTKFLKALKSHHGNVSRAVASIRVSRSAIYQLKLKDADFSQAWNDIIASVYDEMESELYERAVTGWIDKDGIRHKSDRLLEFALKGNRPEKYRERVDLSQTVAGSLDVALQSAIDDVYGSENAE